MNSQSKIIGAIVALFIFNACATYKPQYRGDNRNEVFPQDKTIVHSFYLIGDGGNSPIGESTNALKEFKTELNQASKQSTALFLGDNIYPSGLPKKMKKAELLPNINSLNKLKL